MEQIFDAVLKSDQEVARLLKTWPELSNSRMAEDHLVEIIPHWLYVGDTPLHLAAAALQFKAAKLLLDGGADVNAEKSTNKSRLLEHCLNTAPILILRMATDGASSIGPKMIAFEFCYKHEIPLCDLRTTLLWFPNR